MNVPYVKQFKEIEETVKTNHGEKVFTIKKLMNPITIGNPYVNEYKNRKERRDNKIKHHQVIINKLNSQIDLIQNKLIGLGTKKFLIDEINIVKCFIIELFTNKLQVPIKTKIANMNKKFNQVQDVIKHTLKN